MGNGNVTAPRLPILVAAGFTIGSVMHSITKRQLKRLRAKGFNVTIVPFDMKDMTDVQHYASHIEAEANRVAVEYDVEKLDIVGISMGGSAVTYAIKRGGLLRRTASCITVGSPHFGSRLSLLAHPTVLLRPLKYVGVPLDMSHLGRQLSVGSMFLKHLHSDPLPEGLPFISIALKDDYICPPSTALLPGTTQLTMPGSHHDLLHNEDLLESVFSLCHDDGRPR